MIFRRVCVLDTVVSKVREEIAQVRFRETGGPMVGYVSLDRALVVTDVSGPGPRAELRRDSVLIDGIHAQRFCNQAYRRSRRRIDYVGDWHRHMGFSLEPSPRDIEAMVTMANFEHSPTRMPISLICRKYLWAFNAYVLVSGNRLERLPASILSADELPE